MVRRRYSVEYREELVKTLLGTEQVMQIAGEQGITPGQLRKWARRIIREYSLTEIAVSAEQGLVIDGVPVEQWLQSYLEEPKRRLGNFHFDAQKYPERPGCYLMKDRDGEIIYIGKAKSLRNRLGSYFHQYLDWKKTELLVGDIREIEIMIVNTEAEALFLENNLIKLHRPKYNRALMRENSGYAFLVLTEEESPRLILHYKKRGSKEAAGHRFGPFLNAQLLLDIATEEFQIRTCHPLPRRVCLSYHLHRCSGICEQMITPEEYAAAVQGAIQFLSYKPEEQIREIEAKMLACAERLEFEKAQKLKKRMDALQILLEKQVVEREAGHDQDVLYFGDSRVLVMNIERGMVYGMQLCDVGGNAGGTTAQEFLLRRYGSECPRELIVNALADAGEVEESLSALNGYRVRVTLPQRGVKADLLRLCEENYRYRVGEENLSGGEKDQKYS